jgi:hypothetical protein
VEVKDFQIIHSKSCREPVELKDLQASTAFPWVVFRGGLKEEKITP